MLDPNSSDNTRSSLRSHRVLLLALIGLLTVLLVVLGLQKLQSNSASRDSVTALVMLSLPPHNYDKATAQAFLEAQPLSIQSESILQSALARPQIAESKLVKSQTDPVDWLRQELEVNLIPGSPALRLQLKSPPGHSAISVKIVDTIIKAYRKKVEKEAHTRRNEQRENLTKLHTELQAELQEKTARYHTLATGIGESPNVGTTVRRLVKEIRYLRIQIMKKKMAINEIERLESLNKIHMLADGKNEHQNRRDRLTTELVSLEAKYDEKVAENPQGDLGELTMLESEIRQLQEISNTMEHEIRTWSIFLPRVLTLLPATARSNPFITE